MNGSVDALPPGAQMGQYRLIEAASQGGFGILYRAWDEKLKRPVAVKECFPASICRRDPETGEVQPHTESLRANYVTAINDVYEEAQTLAGLHHAQVVPVYDVFHSAGSMFYVMPWLEGGSLHDKIAAAENVPAEESTRWLLSLLSALEYLHSRQIIHRDIKPGNIMFDADGNPVLVDFGSALNRATKVDTTTQGEFTPVYASPEQVSGKGKIGPWTDLYALAATWYELLGGSEPEPAQQRLVRDDLAPLPAGTTVLEQSIMQNLALSPEERCQSAREWQEWLQAGLTPVIIARKRRSALLWSIPVLLVGAACIYYAGTRQDAEPAPAAPPAGEEKVIPDEDFFNQVCQRLHLDEQAKELEQITQRCQTLLQEHCRKVDELLEQRRKEESSAADFEEKSNQLRDYVEDYKNLQKESRKMIDALAGRGHEIAARMMEACYDPDTVYPWDTMKEFQQLRQFQPVLERKYKPYQGKFLSNILNIETQLGMYGMGEIIRLP